jgi:hypothetical protein
MGCHVVIDLVQDKEGQRALLNTVKNFMASIKGREYLD